MNANAAKQAAKEALKPVAGHLRAIANRQTSAVDDFIALLMESFALTVDQAEKVFAIYRKAKIIKLDTWMGKYNLTHGAFWEPDVIQRTVDLKEGR